MIDTKLVTVDGIIAGIFVTIIAATLFVLFYATVYSIAQEACK